MNQEKELALPPGNQLFPVFLKLEELPVLIVGGGNVALEKLSAILHNSPGAKVRLVAEKINPSVRELAATFHVEISERPFEDADLDNVLIVIIAVNDTLISREIRNLAKQKGRLVNVADKPALCDFYMSSIVKKGDLKIAISTNGKSPTIAKRLKEQFTDLLPDRLDDILQNMEKIRNQLATDFNQKVKALDEITKDLVGKNSRKHNV